MSWGSGQSFLSSFIIYSLKWPQYIFYIRRYNILLRPLARLYIIPDYSVYIIITYNFIHILCHTLLLRVCMAGSGPREEFSYWLPQVIIIIYSKSDASDLPSELRRDITAIIIKVRVKTVLRFFQPQEQSIHYIHSLPFPLYGGEPSIFLFYIFLIYYIYII